MIGYLKHVLLPVSLVSIVSFVPCYMAWKQVPGASHILTALFIAIVCVGVIACLGISANERQMIMSAINKIRRKKKLT